MKKLLTIALASCTLFLTHASEDVSPNDILISSIQTGDVEAVQEQLTSWNPTAEQAETAVKEVHQLLLKTFSKAPWYKNYGALAQVALDTPLLFISGRTALKSFEKFKDFRGMIAEDIGILELVMRFVCAELPLENKSRHSSQ